LRRGCTVLSGEGEMRVLRVGDKTALGEISQEVQIDTRESPLKIRLAKLAKQISRLGYLAAILVALTSLWSSFVIESGFNRDLIYMKLSTPSFFIEKLLAAFMLGLTVIVVAVPEGLPMMIAVVLSSNIKRMIRDNILVRKPVGIEAAGSMNILFTDKTGTLTYGKPTLEEIILADLSSFESASQMAKKLPSGFSLYNISCRNNTSAELSGGEILGGNSTERALLESVKRFPAPRGISLLSKLPFDSSNKYSAVTLGDGRTFVKGAAEKL
ncbi:MAG: cation-transporting P-type ATPase, partial [Clostridia bacterium]|nr:cation-transporting P-type ATPase [Clostridia bacterium]